MHHQHVRHRDHLRHRREIAQHVIRQLLGDEMIDGDGAGAEQERVAVGRRADHRCRCRARCRRRRGSRHRTAGPVTLLRCSAYSRASASAVPPGAVGTRILTGLFGQGALRLRVGGDQEQSQRQARSFEDHHFHSALNVCRAGDVGPFHQFGFDQRRELRRRAADRLGAVLRQPFAHLGRAQCFGDGRARACRSPAAACRRARTARTIAAPNSPARRPRRRSARPVGRHALWPRDRQRPKLAGLRSAAWR